MKTKYPAGSYRGRRDLAAGSFEKKKRAQGRKENRDPCQLRRKNMLQLERLNGSALYLNVFQIECMECIPETKIRMMNGDFFLVRDTVESVCQQMERVMQRYIHKEIEEAGSEG